MASATDHPHHPYARIFFVKNQNLAARKICRLFMHSPATMLGFGTWKPDVRLHVAVWLARKPLRMQGYRKVLAAHAPEEK